MLEPPPIPPETLISALRSAYALGVADLTFLPLGHDVRSFAFQVRASSGAALFLKLRTGPLNPASLLVPRYLHDQGVPGIVAPLRTVEGSLSTSVGSFTLSLYPFIDGHTGMDGGMSEHHWTAFGALLRRVHDTPPSPDLTAALHREDFAPPWRTLADRLDQLISIESFNNPIAIEMAAFWRERRPQIRHLLDRSAQLATHLRAANPPVVLCHADIHTWNLLIGLDERPWIIDWDDTLLAPKERDLMFTVGGLGRTLVSPEAEAWFLAGYGPVAIDPLALAYYRYARALDDLTVCAETVLLMPDRTAATRYDALNLARALFAPGALVELARAADTDRWV